MSASRTRYSHHCSSQNFHCCSKHISSRHVHFCPFAYLNTAFPWSGELHWLSHSYIPITLHCFYQSPVPSKFFVCSLQVFVLCLTVSLSRQGLWRWELPAPNIVLHTQHHPENYHVCYYKQLHFLPCQSKLLIRDLPNYWLSCFWEVLRNFLKISFI